MKDRIAAHPGRVKLTPVTGLTNVYDMVRQDSATQIGTPLNKASLLTDATAALLGLSSSATVNDALEAVANGKAQIAYGSYSGTGTSGSAHKNTLTFGFVPQVVFVWLDFDYYARTLYGTIIPWIHGDTSGISELGASGSEIYNRGVTIAWSGKTVSWYDASYSSPSMQLNQSGKTYKYIAIG